MCTMYVNNKRKLINLRQVNMYTIIEYMKKNLNIINCDHYNTHQLMHHD